MSAALVLSNAKELSIKNRALGKADSFLRQTQDRREILRFAQDKLGMTTECTRRAAPGRPWFWILLPKQKDLAVRGRNPASIPSRRAGATPRKHSLSPCGGETPQAFPLVHSNGKRHEACPFLTPFQTSPTIGMTIPVLAAPRTARTKNKEKSVDFRTCDSYNPHKSFGGFAVSYRSTSFQSSITEKGEEGLT